MNIKQIFRLPESKKNKANEADPSAKNGNNSASKSEAVKKIKAVFAKMIDALKRAAASAGAFFARLFATVKEAAVKLWNRVFKKKAKEEPADDDFDVIDDYDDISGGLDDELLSEDVIAEAEEGDELLTDPIGSDSSEFFDGKLTPEEEERLFTTQNIPVMPSDVRKSMNQGLAAGVSPKEPTRRAETDADAEAANEGEMKKEQRIKRFWRIWSIVRVPIIAAATLFIVYFIIHKVGMKLYNNYLMPVDPDDPTPVVVTIPNGSGASAIAKILYEACGEDQPGLISHKAVFKVYVDFIGKSSKLQAGTFVLAKNMSIPDIVDTICRGMPPREIIKLQVVEGMTIESMAAKLVEQGILSSPDRFLELCKTGETFVKDHPFIEDIPDDETGERPYKLEGFLFPDTYEIYAGANEETIIDKMLSRFEQIFGPIYRARAKELGMSMYEVVTLASTIEKEARLKDDFARVSAVFFNRMQRSMNLDSDATLEYVLKTGSLHLTEEQLSTPSGYNTHINGGLPLGPVSNPGDAALNAALYPNAEYISEEYLFFCLMNPENGALIFAKTLSEHNANVAKYSPLW